MQNLAFVYVVQVQFLRDSLNSLFCSFEKRLVSKKNGVYNADVCIVMIKWRQAKKKDGRERTTLALRRESSLGFLVLSKIRSIDAELKKFKRLLKKNRLKTHVLKNSLLSSEFHSGEIDNEIFSSVS